MENNKLPDDIFLLADVKPTKDDANQAGHVLFYSPLAGWHQATWSRSHMADATHWTFLPDAPPEAERRTVRLESGFNAWYNNQFPGCEPQVKALLRLGYMAGANFENHGTNF